MSDLINDRIKIETEHYKFIDKEKFDEFFDIQSQIKKEDLIININSFIEKVDELKLDKSKYNLNWFLNTLHSIEEAEELIEFFKDLRGKKAMTLNDFNKFINDLLIIGKFSQEVNDKDYLKLLFFFEKVNSNNLVKLQKKLSEFEQEKSTFLSSIFKGGALSAISEDVQNMMGITKVSNLNLKHDADRVIRTMNLYFELEEFCKSQPDINFDNICKIIKKIKTLSKIKDLFVLLEKYVHLFKLLQIDSDNAKKIDFNSQDLETLFSNKLAETDKEKIILLKRFYEMEEFFSKSFNIKDRFDYTSMMKQLQSLYTSKMANELDGKLIKFYGIFKFKIKIYF